MDQMRNAKDSTGRSRKKPSPLDGLKPEEANDLLRRLLAAHPDLVDEAERTARSLLGAVTFEGIADEVEAAVRALHIADLNRRAGRHQWGYVEPTEAAWDILEEALEPFIKDMKRRIKLGLEAEALEICKGVLLGLYRLEHGKSSEVVEWVPDFPAETAGWGLEIWWAGDDGTGKRVRASGRRSRPPFPQDFVNRCLPEWGELIACVLSRMERG